MQKKPLLSRRRILQITALGGLGAATFPLKALSSESALHLHRWHGTALGAEAAITLSHRDRAWAQSCLTSVQREIDRLENIFSLYRGKNALTSLNQYGALISPPAEMVQLMEKARAFGEATDGAFDITVQPLWILYAEHFRHSDSDPAGPGRADVETAQHLVDFRRISIRPNEISFGRRGMTATLNGIAQGFVTDQISDLLKAKGFDNVLVNMGEARASGYHPAGRPWRMAILDPTDPSKVHSKADLANMAMATSGGYGTHLDPKGRFHHLFDPRTGGSPNHFLSVTVLAREATTADALSTALAVMPEEQAIKCLHKMEGCRAFVIRRDGTNVYL